MISREGFLSEYARRVRAQQPEQLTADSADGLSRLVQDILAELERPQSATKELHLAALLRTSQWRINGNYEGFSAGRIVSHPVSTSQGFGAPFGDAEYAGMSAPQPVSGPLEVRHPLDARRAFVPTLIHGQVPKGSYIFFTYATRAWNDYRDGYGMGFSILTDQLTAAKIIDAVRADPKGIFRLFKTLSDDDRITPPKRHDLLVELPIEAVEQKSLRDAKTYTLQYSPAEAHLHEWTHRQPQGRR